MNEHKHLDCFLDSQHTFSSHNNEKLSKARKGIEVIKYLSSHVPVKTLDQIYKMYVRPYLEFCDIIYHMPMIPKLSVYSFRLTNLMDKIESVQYQDALAVTGAWKGTNTDMIYDGLGWKPLTERRRFRRLVQFFKIQNDFTPEYLKIPDVSPRTHLYGTRSGNAIPTIP